MAAHRREDEGLGAEVPEPSDGGADDHVDVRDPAAARPDRDRVAALDRERRGAERLGDGAGKVGHAGAGEGLADFEHAGQRHRRRLLSALS